MKTFAQLINFVFAQPVDRPIVHTTWDTCITGDFIAQEVHGDRHSSQFVLMVNYLVDDMQELIGSKYGVLEGKATQTITIVDVLTYAGTAHCAYYQDMADFYAGADISTYGGMQQVFEYFNHFPQEA